MKVLLLSRTTGVWGLLVLATLLSWELGHGVGIGSACAGGAAILVVTFVKVRFVVLDFMELRAAPPMFRWIFEGWALLCPLLLVALFLRGA